MTAAVASRFDELRERAWVPAVSVFLVCGAVLCGLMAGEAVVRNRGALVLALAAVLVPVALWLGPALAPVLLVAAALTVEQFPEIAAPGAGGATARIPLFHGLGGFRISDLLLGLMLMIYAAKRGTDAVRDPPRSPVSVAVVCFLATVVLGVGIGLSTGGSAPVALTEVRPYLYLGLAYLITSSVITTRRAVQAVLWAVVLGSALKAFQGVYLFLSVRHLSPRPESVLGHEESLFFALFLVLTMALWLYDLPGPLRRAATAFAPVVVAADLANGRRTAWLILAVGLLVLIVTGIVSLPRRRGFLQRLAIVLLLFSAVYFPAYWNKTGGFAQPARAFRSAIAPDPRDAASNMYRLQEEANLRFNIQQAGPLGKGFGHPINYALPIEDISDVDPYIVYVPHNGVFQLFLRIGILGAIAFWAMIGVAVITACRLARSPDRELAIVGLLVACALPSYVLLGYNDQGFFYYRVAFVIGVLIGLAEACRRLRPRFSQVPRAVPAPVAPPAQQLPQPPRPRLAAVAEIDPGIAQARRRRERRWLLAGVVSAVASAVTLWVVSGGDNGASSSLSTPAVTAAAALSTSHGAGSA